MLAPFQKQQPIDSMEFELFTYADNSILEVRVSGTLEVTYFLEMINVVLSELEARDIKKMIYYNESADSSNISMSDLKLIVRATRRLNDVLAGGSAAAAIGNKLSYGLIRMWQAFNSVELNYDFQLFNSYNPAINWLKNKDC